MAANEISVDLKLTTAQFNAQVNAAAAQARAAFGQGTGGGAAGGAGATSKFPRIIKPPPTFEEKAAKEAAKASAALLKQLGQLAYTAGLSQFRFLESLGAMILPVLAITASLAAMKKTFDVLEGAVTRASSAYAKNITSGGLGLGFTVQRSALAGVLGVGEQDVYNYAAAFGGMNDRLKQATDAIVDTTPALSSLGHDWKIFMYDLDALASMLAATVVPTLRLVIMVFDHLAKDMMTWATKNKAAFAALGDFIMRAIFGSLWDASKLLAARQRAVSGGDPKNDPGVGANPNRLAGSTWEKMGLVVSGMHGTSAAEKTAQHTAMTVDILKKIYAAHHEQAGTVTGSFGTNYSHL